MLEREAKGLIMRLERKGFVNSNREMEEEKKYKWGKCKEGLQKVQETNSVSKTMNGRKDRFKNKRRKGSRQMTNQAVAYAEEVTRQDD